MILTWNPPKNGTPIVFSKSSTDYVLLKNYTGFASIPGEHTYCERAPARHGRKRRETTLNERNVSFDVLILSTDLENLQAKVQALSTAFNPLEGAGILEYKKEDGTIYYLNCIGVSGNPQISASSRTQTTQLTTIKLVADEDPFWHAGSPGIIYLDANPASFFNVSTHYWNVWPFSLSSMNSTLTATNNGSVSAPITVVFTGPMVNPKVVNTYTVGTTTVSDTLSATLALASGETLTINTDPDVMTAIYTVSGVDYNAHKYIDSTAAFWQLQKGQNSVYFHPTSSTAGSGASVTWSERYIGV